MRIEFLEPEELEKISEEEWDYILDYVCDVQSGAHNDWTTEDYRNLQLYGRGGDLLDYIEEEEPLWYTVIDFYEKEFGHQVWPGDDDPEEREVQRAFKLIDEYVEAMLFWYFAETADAMQAHKDWIANTPYVQEFKKNKKEFEESIRQMMEKQEDNKLEDKDNDTGTD